ncbi:zinc phosphodiesterase ELAC protein 1-like [Saccoglossus kowalevskii]|uniref:Zinc phosphodiesterase ELAC protein 1-like n=1 Tax=Saccoglossus kowalevskii TaxID=10224 RepID=A0ABM0MNI0_SACKO|nr:PREDICTED: zinc phosphodiesterase ELAC protein 1-like [Saccoglossus kowalevskii]
MDLTFLGTASCYPCPNRGVSCTVLRNEGDCWMFDCGEGSQIQIQKSNIRPTRITKIFITHLHGDHLFGLPGFLCTIGQSGAERDTPLELYGPIGLRRYIRTSLELSRSMLGFDYIVNELAVPEKELPADWESWQPVHDSTGALHPNEKPGRLIEPDEHGVWHCYGDKRITVKAAPLTHRVPTFGFVIEEATLPGKLDSKKLLDLGVPPGPLYGRIKNGENMTLDNGDVLTPQDVLGPQRLGRKIVILGDTSCSEQITSVAMDTDILVHEATLENELLDKCIENGHSTPGMAAEFANKINAKKLILTHFSQRYRAVSDTLKEGEESVGKLIKQAELVFSRGDVVAADDLMQIVIPQH